MNKYRLLGIGRNAAEAEIKRAYRKLAQEFHPDKHTKLSPQERAVMADKFRRITDAYRTLVDDSKRAAYGTFEGAAQDLWYDATDRAAHDASEGAARDSWHDASEPAASNDDSLKDSNLTWRPFYKNLADFCCVVFDVFQSSWRFFEW